MKIKILILSVLKSTSAFSCTLNDSSAVLLLKLRKFCFCKRQNRQKTYCEKIHRNFKITYSILLI